MQDLEVIIRNNAKAVEAHALKTRNEGKWGLAKYVGLNFHSFAEFDTEAERNTAACEWVNEAPGRRTSLINPVATV